MVRYPRKRDFALSLVKAGVEIVAKLLLGKFAPIVLFVFNTATMPLAAILGTVVFINLRVLKEDYSFEKLTEELDFPEDTDDATVGSNTEHDDSVELTTMNQTPAAPAGPSTPPAPAVKPKRKGNYCAVDQNEIV